MTGSSSGCALQRAFKTNLGEVRVKLSNSAISALKEAIQNTAESIREGRKQVETILQHTLEEILRLEQEHANLKKDCLGAIEQVEQLEKESKLARERLMVVNRDVRKYTETDMQQAYESAQKLQASLGQWREREAQLRVRRDDVARQLKGLQGTVNRAEAVLLQFDHISSYLRVDLDGVTSMIGAAHEQALLGLQMLQIQEDEKKVFATRLHDGPMQSLASVAMLMQIPDHELGQGGHARNIRTRLNDVLGDIRQVVFDLRPPLLDDLGLVPTLRRYLQQWESTTKVMGYVRLLGLEAALSPTEKVTVFRGVQEALNNVVKHSEATEVSIALLYGPDSLRVCIEDNGVGIESVDWQDWLENGKLGLALCRQRLGMLGGTVEIAKRSPVGTELIMELPIIGGSQRDTE